jgi:cell division protein FtsB
MSEEIQNETNEPASVNTGTVNSNENATANPYGDVPECYLTDGAPDWHKMQADIAKYQKENTDLMARNNGLRRQLSKGNTFEDFFVDSENNPVFTEIFPGVKNKEAVDAIKEAYGKQSQEGRDAFKNVCKKIGLNQTQADTMALFFMDTASEPARRQAERDEANQKLIDSEAFAPTVESINKIVETASKFYEFDDNDQKYYEKLQKDPEALQWMEKVYLALVKGLSEKQNADQKQSVDISDRNVTLASQGTVNEYNWQDAAPEAQREFLNKARNGEIKTGLTKRQIDWELTRLCVAK